MNCAISKPYYLCIQKVYLECPVAPNCTINKIKSSLAPRVGLVTFKGAGCHNDDLLPFSDTNGNQ